MMRLRYFFDDVIFYNDVDNNVVIFDVVYNIVIIYVDDVDVKIEGLMMMLMLRLRV